MCSGSGRRAAVSPEGGQQQEQRQQWRGRGFGSGGSACFRVGGAHEQRQGCVGSVARVIRGLRTPDMALFAASLAGEAAGVSWRFRGSKNTPFKPVDLPLPVSCGEVRAALKEEIGLSHTPQLDALLFFAEDEETSPGEAAAAPLSDFLTLSRPCRVVLQRTSAAAAVDALARADALLQGAGQPDEKQRQQTPGRAVQQRQVERQSAEGLSVPLRNREQRPKPVEGRDASSFVRGSAVTGGGQQRELPPRIPADELGAAAARDAASVGAPCASQQEQPHRIPRQPQEAEDGVRDAAAEEAQEAEARAADEEAEAALLHAVIEQHAEHRGPQQQQAGSGAAVGLRSGWGRDGKGVSWGGVSGGMQQQQHGRRNLVWSRDGVGSSSAAAVAAATSCIPVAGALGREAGASAAFGSRGAAGAAARGGAGVAGGGGGAAGSNSSYYYGYSYYFPVDADYICHFCGERGTHHIKNCSKAQDPRQQKKVKPATGIPSSFLQDIDVNDIPAHQEVYIRRDGSFAVMKNTKKLSSHSFFSLDLETKVERHTGSSSCTSQLRCGLCNTLFKNPVITPCCGETFCRGCLLRALQQQLLVHRFEEQQQYGVLSTIKDRMEAGGGIAHVKQELSTTEEKYLRQSGIGDGAVERGRRFRSFSQQLNAHSGAAGHAVRMAKGGGSFAAANAATRRIGRGGLCPACGSALDLKDVVDNVALRKCVDAIVLPGSSQEDSTAQMLQQKQQTLQQNKQQEQQWQQQQQQQQQQQTRRVVKGQKGGGVVQQQLQDQVKQENEQPLLAVKKEERQLKTEQQQMQVQSRAAAEVVESGATAPAAVAAPTSAAHSSCSREESSTAGASSVVSAARVVVKTEAGAAPSSSATPVRPPSSSVASTDSNGSASATVLPPPSLFPDVKKIQHHEYSPAIASAAVAADTHKTSAAAASAVTAAPPCTTALAGFCVGLQAMVPQQHEPTGTIVATLPPTVTASATTQRDVETEEQRTDSSIMAGSCSSASGSSGSGSSASGLRNSTISGAHMTAAADGTSGVSSAAAVHVSGGPTPQLPAASLPHCATGASRASGTNSSTSSCYSSSSSQAVYGVVQGEKTDNSVVTNVGTTHTGASGAETQGDGASTSKSGVLNGLDISQLQEQQDFAAAYIQQYMERKKDKAKKRKKRRRRHADTSSTDTDSSSSSEERTREKKHKKRKKRMSAHRGKGR